MAKQLSELYHELVTKVYMDDAQSQQHYLSVVAEHRHISIDYLMSRGCMFIPNNEYIHHYLGKDADTYGCELYLGDRCVWTLFFILPIEDLVGDVVGIVGWDAQNKFLESTGQEEGLPMYKVSSKYVFDKNKYFLSDIGLLKREFDNRSIFITDGVFDSVALNYRGLPAVALLGSTFSREILFFLRWYRQVFVCADNDDAGVRLYRDLSRALPCVRRVVQNGAKDIEELLRNDPLNGPLTSQLRAAVQDTGRSDIYLSRK